MKQINWGIMGCGNIAHSFAKSLAVLPEAKLKAVASRSLDKAQEFAEQHKADSAYGSYEALVEDPDVEVIYIATPHNHHKSNTLLCLDNNKAVLCEKPLTINVQEAEELVAKAKDNNLFLMEALWTRFLPVMQQLQQWIAEGTLGEIKMVKADFGFPTRHGKSGRHLNPELAGGALLDIGIYPITLAYMVFKDEPKQVFTTAKIGETGVDELSSYVFDYGDGRIALLSSTVTMHTPKDGYIIGSKGYVQIPEFWQGKKATLYLQGEEPQSFDFHFDTPGYEFEAQAVMDSLKKGEKENPIMPLSESLRVMGMMDRLRAEWGFKYDFE
ncbi:MAG: Gfo/Idh/MocA family oxidoreductase [Bacteroidota bacterium]